MKFTTNLALAVLSGSAVVVAAPLKGDATARSPKVDSLANHPQLKKETIDRALKQLNAPEPWGKRQDWGIFSTFEDATPETEKAKRQDWGIFSTFEDPASEKSAQ